jgi:phage head maturation protease
MGTARSRGALGATEKSEATEANKTTCIGFAPIVRVDAARREIELCATSEAVDSHGTIFDYDASKEAFTRWIGNVREMHGRQAVGTRVAVRCDDDTRRIYVRIRVSRGARDTWEKVLDGTLRGASIGASGVVWQQQRRRIAGEQRTLRVATRYDLVELSLVDNPSNPDARGSHSSATPHRILRCSTPWTTRPSLRSPNTPRLRGSARRV